jgi:hypothetical protein
MRVSSDELVTTEVRPFLLAYPTMTDPQGPFRTLDRQTIYDGAARARYSQKYSICSFFSQASLEPICLSRDGTGLSVTYEGRACGGSGVGAG